MNHWNGIGRLTKDPEIYGEGTGLIAKYTLAVDRRFKKEGQDTADFINCVCFSKSAEFAEKYFKKGMKVAVVGRIQTGSYEKDGRKIYTTDIIVEEQEFCESKSANSDQKEPSKKDSDFMEISQDVKDDMPF